jgi:Calcineurin-like phosphoesterase
MLGCIMTGHSIVFAGDPHRNFSPILRACAALPPGTLVLLGDCECDVPLPELLAPAMAAGWDVRWILGNRDTDSARSFDNLVGAYPAGNIGGLVAEVGGVRIAGLAGVFKPRVWHPVECEPPQFHTRAEFLRALPPAEHWRGGLPLWHRDTIFPEDFDRLCGARFDVLVTHEAPSSHRHGFTPIDELAAQGGARWIVHGHHHQSYMATLPNGIRVRGLGIAECWDGATLDRN